MTEKRKFLRFETAFNAICNILSEKYKAPYKVKNISKEGALLLLDRKLREGDEMDVSMDVPGDNMPVFATCQVAWQKPLDKGSSYDTGVKFTKIDNPNRGRLLEYIYTQWLRVLDRK